MSDDEELPAVACPPPQSVLDKTYAMRLAEYWWVTQPLVLCVHAPSTRLDTIASTCTHTNFLITWISATVGNRGMEMSDIHE